MSNEIRKFGDRRDAKLCRDITGMAQICIDLKPKRSLGELYVNQKYDVTNLVEYINKYKKIRDEENKITYFHAFVTAVAKVIYNRPLLNRFVANRHVYEHNDVSLSFVMKTEFNDKSEEIMVITPVEKDDNIFTVSDKIRSKVNKVRKKGDTGKGANDAIQIIGKLPNLIRVPIVGLFKFLDQKGLLPGFLVEDNLYYSSMVLSNIGTLKCGGIYHNVTDFGTCSGLITMGEIKEEVVKENGKDVTKYYCEFGVTIDERIADGFYMIKSLQLLQYILNRPELLEGRADEKIEN
ncbi:MAG: 2-oxo acid dehydrogenase subunit E2 [Bacilli bacterium]|nr:2-oxo acid dehydrogenase subunit E2 [Bacilli bacterium]MBQ8902248.1 2-oxo acid dehydrogenase subunit E2 [Bacilli bacterium]